MSTIRKQLDEMIDYLPESDQTLLFEIVKRFIPDDIADASDLKDIQTARDEYKRGETINHNSINWN